jgi:hypothetical protein
MKKARAYLNVFKLRLNMTAKREIVRNYPVAAFIESNLFLQSALPGVPDGSMGCRCARLRRCPEDKLICHKCPIPMPQNYTDPIIAEVATNLREAFSQEKSLGRKARYLMSYLLMGAPTWYGLGRTRALAERVLFLRAAN